jgi:hypothetical protein
MRTTREIVVDLEIAADSGTMFSKYKDKPAITYEELLRIVFEARKETIEEIANRTYIADDNHNHVITKSEILSFVKDLQ